MADKLDSNVTIMYLTLMSFVWESQGCGTWTVLTRRKMLIIYKLIISESTDTIRLSLFLFEKRFKK